MVTAHIVTPHGGSFSELVATAKSIGRVQTSNSLVAIHWTIVLNNGASADFSELCNFTGFEPIVLDINPIGCRSTARNHAINYLVNEKVDENGFVMFLDSGDLLEDGLISELQRYIQSDFILGLANVSTTRAVKVRKQPSLKLINYINPIYLGSVFIKLKYVKLVRFDHGRKEDWKFWIKLLQFKPNILQTDKLAYTYTIKHKIGHGYRKIKLIKDQWRFFRQFKEYGLLKSTVALIVHYALNLFFWTVL